MKRVIAKIDWTEIALRDGVTMDEAAKSLSILLGSRRTTTRDELPKTTIITSVAGLELYEADCLTEEAAKACIKLAEEVESDA